MNHTVSIVIFDPEDPDTLRNLAEALTEYHSVLIPYASEEALREAIGHHPVDVFLLKLEKPFEQAFNLLSEIQVKAPQAQVIFVAQFDDEMLWAWMGVIQRGAYEFLPKPLDPEELKLHVVSAVEKNHPLQLLKRPPAESVKDLYATSKKRISSAGA
jgi:DNA-binding NtrC family response regulator